MIAILRKKKYAKHGAVKSLDYALLNCVASCEKFVELSGLKALFAVFMKKHKKKNQEFEASDHEHTVSIIVQLFLNLSDVHYFRLLRKFQENDFQKVERLLELQEEYTKRVAAAEKKWLLERAESQEADSDDELLDAGGEYERKVEAGLMTLQNVCFLLGFVATAGESKMTDRISKLLYQNNSDISKVQTVLAEFAGKIDPEATQTQKLKKALDAIVLMLSPAEAEEAGAEGGVGSSL